MVNYKRMFYAVCRNTSWTMFGFAMCKENVLLAIALFTAATVAHILESGEY